MEEETHTTPAEKYVPSTTRFSRYAKAFLIPGVQTIFGVWVGNLVNTGRYEGVVLAGCVVALFFIPLFGHWLREAFPRLRGRLATIVASVMTVVISFVTFGIWFANDFALF